MYCRTYWIGNHVVFNGHKNVQVGSGSVLNGPPVSVIQDYGYADPDPQQKLNLTLSLFLYLSERVI
jgi:hypothetical protein